MPIVLINVFVNNEGIAVVFIQQLDVRTVRHVYRRLVDALLADHLDETRPQGLQIVERIRSAENSQHVLVDRHILNRLSGILSLKGMHALHRVISRKCPRVLVRRSESVTLGEIPDNIEPVSNINLTDVGYRSDVAVGDRRGNRRKVMAAIGHGIRVAGDVETLLQREDVGHVDDELLSGDVEIARRTLIELRRRTRKNLILQRSSRFRKRATISEAHRKGRGTNRIGLPADQLDTLRKRGAIDKVGTGIVKRTQEEIDRLAGRHRLVHVEHRDGSRTFGEKRAVMQRSCCRRIIQADVDKLILLDRNREIHLHDRRLRSDSRFGRFGDLDRRDLKTFFLLVRSILDDYALC